MKAKSVANWVSQHFAIQAIINKNMHSMTIFATDLLLE
jgi:hypothetical protein